MIALTHCSGAHPNWMHSTPNPALQIVKYFSSFFKMQFNLDFKYWVLFSYSDENVEWENLTKYTWSKISVGLSIWPRMTIISLSMNSLNSRRLHTICISSSARICEEQNNNTE